MGTYHYTLSHWLQGSKFDGKNLSFKQGANFFISFYDESVIKDIIRTILDDPQMFCGLEVTDVQIAKTPNLKERTTFYCGSPIFIKRRMPDGHVKQFNYNDPESSSLMKETLVNKMRKAGLADDDTLEIKFDTSYTGKRLKLVITMTLATRQVCVQLLSMEGLRQNSLHGMSALAVVQE